MASLARRSRTRARSPRSTRPLRALDEAGAEVVVARTDDARRDLRVRPRARRRRGVVLLRPGKAERPTSPTAMAAALERRACSAARLEEPLLAEGGDLFWLDARTLCAGRGYRTNSEGSRARAAARSARCSSSTCRTTTGRDVLHLLSLISPLADDLVVAYPPLLPVRLAQLLGERGIEIVEVPDEEFETLGPNALALAPAGRLDPRAEPRDAAAARGGRRRGGRLPRGRAEQGRGRADLPHASAGCAAEARHS